MRFFAHFKQLSTFRLKYFYYLCRRIMLSILRHMVLLLVLAGVFCSCSFRHDVQEARHIVAEADSLRAEGVAYEDSTAIAQAATALSRVRAFFPTDYAHANYYYGRVLRNRGDHPAAMQAFLRTIHSRTQDHAIKARTYANVANMCRLAAEHELAYDMYGKAAQEFFYLRDSLMYFYSLNNQAYDLAEQGIKNRALAITYQIEHECLDFGVLTKIWETRANTYVHTEQFDSAIYCFHQLQSRGNYEPTGFLLAAQAFYWLGQNDSALYYAKKTLEVSDYYGDKFNVLYIMTHCDSTLSSDDVLSFTSEREDLRYYEYEPVKEKLIQAVQLLEQDINRKPDFIWLWAIFATILFIGIPSGIYISRKRKKHQLTSQKTAELQRKNDELSFRTVQLKSVHSAYEERVKQDVVVFCQNVLSESDPKQSIGWGDYNRMREIVNKNMFGLIGKLEDLGLVEHEIEFCVLVLLKLSRKDSAEWMRLSETSIGGKKRDIAEKLGQTSAKLYDFLLSVVCK